MGLGFKNRKMESIIASSSFLIIANYDIQG